jgi:hypothetical protein
LPAAVYNLNSKGTDDNIPKGIGINSTQRFNLKRKATLESKGESLNSMGGLEAIQEMKQKIKVLKEDCMELLRQDRLSNEYYINKVVNESESRIMFVIEEIRQNLFEFYNEKTLTRGLPDQ